MYGRYHQLLSYPPSLPYRQITLGFAPWANQTDLKCNDQGLWRACFGATIMCRLCCLHCLMSWAFLMNASTLVHWLYATATCYGDDLGVRKRKKSSYRGFFSSKNGTTMTSWKPPEDIVDAEILELSDWTGPTKLLLIGSWNMLETAPVLVKRSTSSGSYFVCLDMPVRRKKPKLPLLCPFFTNCCEKSIHSLSEVRDKPNPFFIDKLYIYCRVWWKTSLTTSYQDDC